MYTRGAYMPYMYTRWIHVYVRCIHVYARCIHVNARCIHAIHVHEVYTCTRGAHMYTRGVYIPMRVGIQLNTRRREQKRTKTSDNEDGRRRGGHRIQEYAVL
jgi:hypothetical protein